MSHGIVQKIMGDWSYHIRGSVIVCTSLDNKKRKRYVTDIFLDASSYKYNVYGIRCGRKAEYEKVQKVLKSEGYNNCVDNDSVKVWEKGNCKNNNLDRY